MSTSTRDVATVHLRVCPLSYPAVRRMREILAACDSGPGHHLIVDLREMDDRHELTVFALLAEAARVTASADGSMTALRPSSRMAQLLLSVGVPVTRKEPAVAPGTTMIDVGACVAAR